MKRLFFVIFLALMLSSCTKRYFIILDSNSSARQNKEVILIDKNEKPKVKTVFLGVNFIPSYGPIPFNPPRIIPVNQYCLPRPIRFIHW